MRSKVIGILIVVMLSSCVAVPVWAESGLTDTDTAEVRQPSRRRVGGSARVNRLAGTGRSAAAPGRIVQGTPPCGRAPGMARSSQLW